MALLWFTSHDSTTTVTHLYINASMALSAGNGRRGTNSVRSTGNNGVSRMVTPGDNTCVFGAAIRMSAIGVTASRVMTIGEFGSINHISIVVNAAGKIEVRRGDAAGTLLGTSTSSMVANVYTYIEIKVLISDTVGTVELRINGSSTPEINLTSQDTRNAGTGTYNSVHIGFGNNFGNLDADDIYVCDGTGSAPFNTFLGDCRVDAHLPSANGSNNGSTPSTGSDRYATIDETPPNSDTDYNSLAAVNDKDTVNLPALAAVGVGTLYAVQVLAFAKKADAGAATICPVLRHSGTDYDGASSTGMSTDYTYALQQIYQQNPGTSADWTESDFNALEAGYKRTA